MNTKTYNTLKIKQQNFIKSLHSGIVRESEDNDHDVTIIDSYSRQYLKMMSAKYCGMQWAPAWIVKDKSRQFGGGSYSLPELKDYHDTIMKSEELPAEDGETMIIGTEVVSA